VDDGVLDDDAAARIEAESAEKVAAAVAFADASPEPAEETLFDFAYATDVPNAPRMMPGDPVLPAGWDEGA
jgi:pyruvate dehydrogenase E1 component alpha subunit